MFYVNPYLRFRFIHSKPAYKFKMQTTCIIEKCQMSPADDIWVLLGTGSARCGKDDNFSRKIGRQLSLTRALESMYFRDKKDLRTEIWETYFANVSDLK